VFIISVCSNALRPCKPVVWLLPASVSVESSSVSLSRPYVLILQAGRCNDVEGQNVNKCFKFTFI
jgi:hypothetical protein